MEYTQKISQPQQRSHMVDAVAPPMLGGCFLTKSLPVTKKILWRTTRLYLQRLLGSIAINPIQYPQASHNQFCKQPFPTHWQECWPCLVKRRMPIVFISKTSAPMYLLRIFVMQLLVMSKLQSRHSSPESHYRKKGVHKTFSILPLSSGSDFVLTFKVIFKGKYCFSLHF